MFRIQYLDYADTKPLPAHMADALRESLFYVLPRMSPDGAEAILKTGRYVRSSPVNDRTNKTHAYWQASDIDGDGHMGYMRQQDPSGELVELRDTQGVPLQPPVMVPRMASMPVSASATRPRRTAAPHL